MIDLHKHLPNDHLVKEDFPELPELKKSNSSVIFDIKRYNMLESKAELK